jgi:hypothetical protein
MPCFTSFWLHQPAEQKDCQIQGPAINVTDLFAAQHTKKHIEFPALSITKKIVKLAISSQYYFYNLSTPTPHKAYYPFKSVTRAPPQSTI